MGAGTVIEKENATSQQTRAVLPDGFLQELQGCTVAICIHCCLMVQEIEENAMGIQYFAKSKIILCKASPLLSRIFKLCINTEGSKKMYSHFDSQYLWKKTPCS
jgi:hypothetical protein